MTENHTNQTDAEAYCESLLALLDRTHPLADHNVTATPVAGHSFDLLIVGATPEGPLYGYKNDGSLIGVATWAIDESTALHRSLVDCDVDEAQALADDRRIAAAESLI